MKIREALRNVQEVRISDRKCLVEQRAAEGLRSHLRLKKPIKKTKEDDVASKFGLFYLLTNTRDLNKGLKIMDRPQSQEWVCFAVDENLCFWLVSSHEHYLYSALCFVLECMQDREVSETRNWVRTMSFTSVKSTFDIFLTQYARMIRNFRREEYIRECARVGFTHLEVNGLAGPFPLEKGRQGEFYKDFYTYCPALDQFVSSRLIKGCYPSDYLRSNLERLKENARLTKKYGLVPGLLCFEPRSVPEALFEKYPTLRGARVDHPFRSFTPRYNLSIVHPVVQEHYAELMTRLLEEVPELEFLTIWSNDSGAGFEHTKSLYVGRNGGAYMIREWRDDADIAQAAAANAVNFFKILKDSASSVNPRFRVITRLESFYGEREHLWPLLADGVDVEGSSLLTKGWEGIYPHPAYPDIKVSGSALHNILWDKEKKSRDELHARGSKSYFYHSFGVHTNHEPLLGIPFPWLTLEKLQALHRLGFTATAHLGGIQPPDKAPFAVNQEVFRRFQFDPDLSSDEIIHAVAQKYVGDAHAEVLVQGWKKVDETIRHFVPLSIYSHYGVVWQRLFIRPLVPDIDRIPEKERSYYESYMCTSIHNPNRVDLAKDVLFELVSKDYARQAYERIDANVWPPLEDALRLFETKKDETEGKGEAQAFHVFEDQLFRVRSLHCLFQTLRNTAVWIYAVHQHQGSNDPSERSQCRRRLANMIEKEIENCRKLIELWEKSPVEWMIVSGTEETPFIYGENFPRLLEKKIQLMERHKNDEPYIDPQYMFRVKNNPYGGEKAIV